MREKIAELLVPNSDVPTTTTASIKRRKTSTDNLVEEEEEIQFSSTPLSGVSKENSVPKDTSCVQ
jgi:hypothetical protein